MEDSAAAVCAVDLEVVAEDLRVEAEPSEVDLEAIEACVTVSADDHIGGMATGEDHTEDTDTTGTADGHIGEVIGHYGGDTDGTVGHTTATETIVVMMIHVGSILTASRLT